LPLLPNQRRQYVRVIQVGGDLYLGQEAFGEQLWTQHLDGNLTVMLQVLGEVPSGRT
jgi:hypothetical protein